jgi:hypothetical protein
VIFSYPTLLEAFPGGIKKGQDILRQFTQTDLGDQVVDAGLVVPIINIDDGGYVVRFFLEAGPPPNERRRVAYSDAGFVLKVEEKLYVADAAVFWEWHEGLSWIEVPVPPGNYSVVVEGVVHLDDEGRMSETGYDIILRKSEALPKRTARIREDSRVPFDIS